MREVLFYSSNVNTSDFRSINIQGTRHIKFHLAGLQGSIVDACRRFDDAKELETSVV